MSGLEAFPRSPQGFNGLLLNTFSPSITFRMGTYLVSVCVRVLVCVCVDACPVNTCSLRLLLSLTLTPLSLSLGHLCLSAVLTVFRLGLGCYSGSSGEFYLKENRQRCVQPERFPGWL